MTIPLYFALLCAMTILLVPLGVVAAAVDCARRRPLPAARTVVFLWYYLLCEVAGILASFALWLASLTVRERRHDRFVSWNYALQRVWGLALGRGSFVIYRIRLEADPVPTTTGRPVIVMIRHASTADTILAAMLIAGTRRTRLRYVLKRELLWDPCLDIVGNRLPNYFVLRGSPDGAAEIEGVGRLMDGLGPNDGVLIYPEGTRFSEAKRARILERLEASGDHDGAARARALRRVLPPRTGGVLELLRRNTSAIGADLVVCVHTGLERSMSFTQMWNGGLVGSTVRVQFWRVPFEAIGDSDEQRAALLHENWLRVDSVVRGLGG